MSKLKAWQLIASGDCHICSRTIAKCGYKFGYNFFCQLTDKATRNFALTDPNDEG